MRTTAHRRTTALAATALAAALLVTGCGGMGDSATDGTGRANGSGSTNGGGNGGSGNGSSGNAAPIQPGPGGVEVPSATTPFDGDDTPRRGSGLTDPSADPLSTFASTSTPARTRGSATR